MKDYENSALLKLCALIREEEGARQWLIDNGYRELAEFWEANERVEKSFRWLLENNHRELAALVDALHSEEKAKMFLVKAGHPELAAVVDAADGNKTAVVFLLKSGNKGWLAVAREIYLWEQKSKKKGIWNIFDFGNPFR